MIEMMRTLLGENHPDTLTSMANLAATYQDQEQWSEAEQLVLQVMEKRKTLLREDSNSMTNILELSCKY